MGVSFSGLLAAARNGAAVVTTKSYTLEPAPDTTPRKSLK
jgi:hypothetical protein